MLDTTVALTPAVDEKTEHKTIDLYKEESTIVTARDLQNDLEEGKDIVISVLGKEGKMDYAWTFDASKMQQNTKFTDIDLKVQIDSAKELGYVNGTLIAMNEKAKLPMQAGLKVDVSSIYKPEDKLYL